MKQSKRQPKQATAAIPPEDARAGTRALRLISMSARDKFNDGTRWGQWCRCVAGAGLAKDGPKLDRLEEELEDGPQPQPAGTKPVPTGSVFLANLHHAYAQLDGTYAFPNSREGDMLKTAKREVGELLQRVQDAERHHPDPAAAIAAVVDRFRVLAGLGLANGKVDERSHRVLVELLEQVACCREHPPEQGASPGQGAAVSLACAFGDHWQCSGGVQGGRCACQCHEPGGGVEVKNNTSAGSMVTRFLSGASQSTRDALTDALRGPRTQPSTNAKTLLDAAQRVEAELERLNGMVKDLEAEVDVLREYGNKDCTAQADEELARRRNRPPKRDSSYLVHVLKGGPLRQIVVTGRTYSFEDHPYCGPVAVDPGSGSPLDPQPEGFLEAVTLWHQQGKQMSTVGGLCVWTRGPVPKPIPSANPTPPGPDPEAPVWVIKVNGRHVPFIDDPEAGPLALDRADTLKVLDLQPWDFLEAAELWVKQGRRTNGIAALWNQQPMGGVQ